MTQDEGVISALNRLTWAICGFEVRVTKDEKIQFVQGKELADALDNDEIETEAQREWAAFVDANPGAGPDQCPSGQGPPQCVTAPAYETAHGEPAAAESVGGAYSVAEDGGSLAADWGGVVQGWQSIAAGCPQPPTYATCPDWPVGNASSTWIGLGLVADTQAGAPANSEWFDAEFGTLP